MRNVSIDQVVAILRLLGGEETKPANPALGPQNACPEGLELGQHIVVLDRGFVYVGNVVEYGDRIRIENAKNIRYWGTTNGLGELTKGPTSKTKLDPVGEVIVYRKAVISLIPCQGF